MEHWMILAAAGIGVVGTLAGHWLANRHALAVLDRETKREISLLAFEYEYGKLRDVEAALLRASHALDAGLASVEGTRLVKEAEEFLRANVGYVMRFSTLHLILHEYLDIVGGFAREGALVLRTHPHPLDEPTKAALRAKRGECMRQLNDCYERWRIEFNRLIEQGQLVAPTERAFVFKMAQQASS